MGRSKSTTKRPGTTAKQTSKSNLQAGLGGSDDHSKGGADEYGRVLIKLKETGYTVYPKEGRMEIGVISKPTNDQKWSVERGKQEKATTFQFAHHYMGTKYYWSTERNGKIKLNKDLRDSFKVTFDSITQKRELVHLETGRHVALHEKDERKWLVLKEPQHAEDFIIETD